MWASLQERMALGVEFRRVVRCFKGFSGAQPRTHRKWKREEFLPLVESHCGFTAMGPVAVRKKERSHVLPNAASGPQVTC